MAKKIKLRRHQAEIEQRATDIILGRIPRTEGKKTNLLVTPGGGKSIAYSIFAGKLLEAGFVDSVFVAVPRSNLQSQMVNKGFPFLPFNKFGLYLATNDWPLIRNENLNVRGYATTYQSVAAKPQMHVDTFKKYGRFLLILDEVHHLAEGGEKKDWAAAISPLVDLAEYCLFGSGTIERWDGNRIPFIDYTQEADGTYYPRRDIVYSRRNAVAEGAIAPLDIQFEDGIVEYVKGEQRRLDIATAPKDQQGAVLRVLLDEYDFRVKLINKAMTHWLAYKGRTSHKSQVVVVCADQQMAKDVQSAMQRDYPGATILRAISDDGTEAHETIENFRKHGRGDVLVTVGMCYEGLDAPPITHVVGLTDVRSPPWLDQCFARANRHDENGPPRDQQFGFIFVPNDPRMQDAVRTIRREQEEGLVDREKTSAGGGTGVRNPGQALIPINATHTGSRHEPLDNSNITTAEQDRLAFVMRHAPGYSSTEVLQMLKLADQSRDQCTPQEAPAYDPDEEKSLRGQCDELSKKVADRRNKDFKEYNSFLKTKFGGARSSLGVTTLRELRDFLIAQLQETEAYANGQHRSI